MIRASKIFETGACSLVLCPTGHHHKEILGTIVGVIAGTELRAERLISPEARPG